MNKILIVAWIVTLVHVGSQELNIEERHNGSASSCEVIKKDYYESRQDSYVKEYIEYCWDVWHKEQAERNRQYRKPITGKTYNGGVGG